MDISNSLSDPVSVSSVPVTNGAPAKSDHKEDRRLQLRRFRENRRKFPAAELAEFSGQLIAWNREGTEILASGDRPLELQAALVKRQLTLQDVWCEQILSLEELSEASPSADFD